MGQKVIEEFLVNENLPKSFQLLGTIFTSEREALSNFVLIVKAHFLQWESQAFLDGHLLSIWNLARYGAKIMGQL